MGAKSRDKGKRYELELVGKFKEQGYKARRSAQYCGNTGDAADVVGLPYIHVEAKRYAQKVFDYDWMEQAVRDSRASGNIPAVFHRTDNHGDLVTMRLEDWFKIYHEYEAARAIDEYMEENG